MSLLGRITAGMTANLDHTQERTGVQVEVTSAHPTPEQVADALLAKLQISQVDRAALKQANGGRDIHDQLSADLRKSGINHAALSYVGAGKYRGYVGLPTETRQRLSAWSRTDGQAPTEVTTGVTAKQQELQDRGALARHRAELALHKQKAKQQIVADIVGTGGAQVAGAILARGLPKAAPLLAEALPPLALGTGLVASMAVTLDKGLELSVEQQMEVIRNAPPMMSEKQKERPPVDTTQQKPSAPTVPSDDELPKGELVPAGKAAPLPETTAPQDQPSNTQPSAPQGESPTPKFDPERGIPTALTTASLGKLATDKVNEAEGLKVPQGLSEAQFEQLSARVREGAGHYDSDIRVHGSRAAGAAKPDSDIDIAIRVSPERFDQIICERFGTPNPGSAKERTMRIAIETGKIQAGELGLRGFRRMLEKELGVETDLSVVHEGGPFDQGPWTHLK